MVFGLPGLLHALAGGKQDVPTGRNLQRPAPRQAVGEIPVQIGLQRTLGVNRMGEPGAGLGEVVRTAGRGAGMAAIEQARRR